MRHRENTHPPGYQLLGTIVSDTTTTVDAAWGQWYHYSTKKHDQDTCVRDLHGRTSNNNLTTTVQSPMQQLRKRKNKVLTPNGRKGVSNQCQRRTSEGILMQNEARGWSKLSTQEKIDLIGRLVCAGTMSESLKWNHSRVLAMAKKRVTNVNSGNLVYSYH